LRITVFPEGLEPINQMNFALTVHCFHRRKLKFSEEQECLAKSVENAVIKYLRDSNMPSNQWSKADEKAITDAVKKGFADGIKVSI
jgi:hypothetical protein